MNRAFDPSCVYNRAYSSVSIAIAINTRTHYGMPSVQRKRVSKQLTGKAAVESPAPVAQAIASQKYEYGTAGFRGEASSLESICAGVMAFARVLSFQHGGQCVGVVVTASHNVHTDNGFKFVLPSGAMLTPTQERMATRYANDIAYASKRMTRQVVRRSRVFITHDTRPSSAKLVALLLAACRTRTIVLGVRTTPESHALVRLCNQQRLLDYFGPLVKAYRRWTRNLACNAPVVVDCANGSGQAAIPMLTDAINTLMVINNGSALINDKCGADFVKTTQQCSIAATAHPGAHHYAFDGDADRLIAYNVRADKTIDLIDGDKISALIATYLRKVANVDNTKYTVGIIHTAYSNGAFIEYVKSFGFSTECVPTGVKHLHKAARRFDVGIYFEANGHGTVCFSPKLRRETRLLPHGLRCLVTLLNPLVGDAVADLLACEAVLAELRMTFEQWAALYTDKPNRLLKMPIRDKAVFKCNSSEERLLQPAHLQRKMDDLMAKHPGSRTFVRPSGTENVLRVYIEAASGEDVATMASRMEAILKDL